MPVERFALVRTSRQGSLKQNSLYNQLLTADVRALFRTPLSTASRLERVFFETFLPCHGRFCNFCSVRGIADGQAFGNGSEGFLSPFWWTSSTTWPDELGYNVFIFSYLVG
jgi:hypothetical protein